MRRVLWDFWERNLDPDLFKDRTLRGTVEGKVCVITGGTSGIGLATAEKLADAGAILVIGARKKERLMEVAAELEARGGNVHAYQCDFADMDDCDRVRKNSAGQSRPCGRVGSITQAVPFVAHWALSFDRFHDFERTMQLNYFGSVRLIMGFAPAMLERRRGHVVNISSIGVLTNAPRFSRPTSRPRSALDTFSRCAAAEWSDRNVTFTTINMPLVKTPMIAPTKIYDSVPHTDTGRSGGNGGRRHRVSPQAHRHASGYFCPGHAGAGAEDGRDRDEHRLPYVPGLSGRCWQPFRRKAEGVLRAGGLCGDHAGYLLVVVLPMEIKKPRFVRGFLWLSIKVSLWCRPVLAVVGSHRFRASD